MQPVRTIWRPISPRGNAPSGAVTLKRRGVHHGRFAPGPRAEVDARAEWDRAAPLHLRGALAGGQDFAGAVRRTRGLFDRLLEEAVRPEADPASLFERDLWRRLGRGSKYESAGAAIQVDDEREIVKVFADRRRGMRPEGDDLWAKLSWISSEPGDGSLRIRFSFGSEVAGEWATDPARARLADDFAEAVFPECARLTRNPDLSRLLRRLTGIRTRMSERIIFANAPGGGARFHHDAEPGQLAVVYAQMAGETAWLAVRKRDLAEVVAAVAPPALARALRGRDGLQALEGDSARLHATLNSEPRLTAALAVRGDLFVLRAGDVLLLPSHGPDDSAWHSVIALGRRPSLAHSYGLFARS